VNAETLDPLSGKFVQMEPFVYADGSNEPPALLRDVPEQNYIDRGLRAAGLSLMAVALVVVFLSASWVFRHREHSVVIAAQPFYLYTLCLGSAIISLNIYFVSSDEGQGWSQEMLDRSCIAAIWVNAIGMLLVYGSIFFKVRPACVMYPSVRNEGSQLTCFPRPHVKKHWRVNRLMQHKQDNKMSVGLKIAPVIFIVSLIVVVQAIWTDKDAYGWEREEIDEMTGESIGQCTGNVGYCLFLTGFFLFVPVALAGAFAYKTLGVDDLYSESKWVLVFILVQFQVSASGL
jgi:7 transmembrane sweet-taste receptor of 3 GCPR